MTEKKSNVVPIHKRDSKNLIKSYQPISLLLIFSKVFERLIFNSLFNYFIQNKLFTESQSGFIPGVTVNIHSPKKTLPRTYLLANKYYPVFFSQDKKTPGSVYLPVNKYCLRKFLLPFSYSVSIIGHNSHRFTPKPSLSQIKSKFSPK